MRSTVVRTCVRRGRRSDILAWARDCVRRPARYGADERTRQIVADLLRRAEAHR